MQNSDHISYIIFYSPITLRLNSLKSYIHIIYKHTHIYRRIHIYTYRQSDIQTHARMHCPPPNTNRHAQTRTDTRTHIHTRKDTHTRTPTHTRARTHTHTHSHIYIYCLILTYRHSMGYFNAMFDNETFFCVSYIC